MNPCPQCGAIPQPSDKFCNICGTPVVAPGGFGAPGGGGFPPPQQGGFGAPPQAYGAPPQQGPLRCQMGHDIPPGASYCPHGHPIALDAMPFANDQYGGGGGYGQQGGFGAPPGQGGFGAPPGGGQYGAPAPAQGFGGAQQQPGFGAPPQDFGGAAQQPAPAAQPPAAPVNLPANALRGFLVSYQSNTSGDFWPLNGGRKTVGRANSGEQVDIPLSDATISSRHAAVIVDATAGTVQVEDTGSTNGTFVNEEHIGFNGKRELRDGDKVRFGGYSTIVKIVGRI